jgi:hypothetical protein
MKLKFVVGLVVLILGITSCSHLGTVVLPPDRLAYNRAILESDEQQTLLNIVRLRYTDTPYFMTVNNVVSQFSFGNNYSVGVSNSAGPPSLLGTGNASVSYSEAPTITYTPLQGEDYVNRLLTPVDLNVLLMLFRSGWSVYHVTRVVVQRFGPLDNASLASRAVSGRIPIYKEFQQHMAVFRRMQNLNNIELRKDLIDNVMAIRVHFKKYSLLTAKERLMLSKFGVSAHSPDFWLVSAAPTAKNQVYVETRTVLGLIYFLSKGVDVPAEDVMKKQVRMTCYPDGKLFNWHDVTKDIMRVRVSKAKPEDAYVAVMYRGSWFYIEQCDFSSKETLNLLGMIMGIYQTKIQITPPVFTIS